MGLSRSVFRRIVGYDCYGRPSRTFGGILPAQLWRWSSETRHDPKMVDFPRFVAAFLVDEETLGHHEHSHPMYGKSRVYCPRRVPVCAPGPLIRCRKQRV